MTKDEALQMCLEYIETDAHERRHVRWAIKKALEAPVQEPVATDWERIARVQDAKLRAMCNEPKAFEQLCEIMDRYEDLRTTPPAAQPAPVQEPVAWQVMIEDEAMEEFSVKDAAHDWCVQQKLAGSPYSYWIRPLYTTPPAAQRQWVGLTDEERGQAINANFGNGLWHMAKDIEAKLKEKNT